MYDAAREINNVGCLKSKNYLISNMCSTVLNTLDLGTILVAVECWYCTL
jgi:hypothetical protein